MANPRLPLLLNQDHLPFLPLSPFSSDLPCHVLFLTNAASLTVKVSMLKTPGGSAHSRHSGLSL